VRWFTYIDPITHAFRAMVAPHFWCEAHGTAACPKVAAIAGTSGIVLVDRYE